MATSQFSDPRAVSLPQLAQNDVVAVADGKNSAPRLHVTRSDQVLSSQTFSQAFQSWIAGRTIKQTPGKVSRAKYISERTEWDYRQYARALGKMFDDVPLCEIDFSSIHEYHRARAFCDGSWAKQAGSNRIQKEVALLIRIMRAAGAWTEKLETSFEPLQREESDVQRALDPKEQDALLDAASNLGRDSFVAHYIVAALQTCASTNELRSLRVGDVQLEQGTISIRNEGAKNKFRVRTIPLQSREVLYAFEQLLARAYARGSRSPHHYLFPFGGRGGHYYDPSRPMSDSGLKKPWDLVRAAAGLPWLRPYDLRHTAMAEAGVSIQIIMSLAGHVSLKMQQHYTTISMTAKQRAVASVWTKDGWPERCRIPKLELESPDIACPECAETIKRAAKKCRYCGLDLTKAA